MCEFIQTIANEFRSNAAKMNCSNSNLWVAAFNSLWAFTYNKLNKNDKGLAHFLKAILYLFCTKCNKSTLSNLLHKCLALGIPQNRFHLHRKFLHLHIGLDRPQDTIVHLYP